jgi:HlyD family secretion protein
MHHLPTRHPSRKPLVAAALFCLASLPALAADEPGPKGAAVTVLTAAKSCFAAIVEVTGTLIPREDGEIAVRPERQGLKVAEVMVDAGDSVTLNQAMARLNLPEGGSVTVQAPVAGVVSASSAVIGSIAGGKGDALFSIIARSEYDLVGLVPTQDIAQLKVNQVTRIKIPGAGEFDGKVRRISPTVEPGVQQAKVFIAVTSNNRRLLVNSSGRALITTGQSCNIAVPLTAILYGTAGTVVQVVRRARVETRHVEIGLMSGGQVEIRDGLVAGDIVVARAGALLREGDPVRPMDARAAPK